MSKKEPQPNVASNSQPGGLKRRREDQTEASDKNGSASKKPKLDEKVQKELAAAKQARKAQSKASAENEKKKKEEVGGQQKGTEEERASRNLSGILLAMLRNVLIERGSSAEPAKNDSRIILIRWIANSDLVAAPGEPRVLDNLIQTIVGLERTPEKAVDKEAFLRDVATPCVQRIRDGPSRSDLLRLLAIATPPSEQKFELSLELRNALEAATLGDNAETSMVWIMLVQAVAKGVAAKGKNVVFGVLREILVLHAAIKHLYRGFITPGANNRFFKEQAVGSHQRLAMDHTDSPKGLFALSGISGATSFVLWRDICDAKVSPFGAMESATSRLETSTGLKRTVLMTGDEKNAKSEAQFKFREILPGQEQVQFLQAWGFNNVGDGDQFFRLQSFVVAKHRTMLVLARYLMEQMKQVRDYLLRTAGTSWQIAEENLKARYQKRAYPILLNPKAGRHYLRALATLNIPEDPTGLSNPRPSHTYFYGHADQKVSPVHPSDQFTKDRLRFKDQDWWLEKVRAVFKDPSVVRLNTQPSRVELMHPLRVGMLDWRANYITGEHDVGGDWTQIATVAQPLAELDQATGIAGLGQGSQDKFHPGLVFNNCKWIVPKNARNTWDVTPVNAHPFLSVPKEWKKKEALPQLTHQILYDSNAGGRNLVWTKEMRTRAQVGGLSRLAEVMVWDEKDEEDVASKRWMCSIYLRPLEKGQPGCHLAIIDIDALEHLHMQAYGMSLGKQGEETPIENRHLLLQLFIQWNDPKGNNRKVPWQPNGFLHKVNAAFDHRLEPVFNMLVEPSLNSFGTVIPKQGTEEVWRDWARRILEITENPPRRIDKANLQALIAQLKAKPQKKRLVKGTQQPQQQAKEPEEKDWDGLIAALQQLQDVEPETNVPELLAELKAMREETKVHQLKAMTNRMLRHLTYKGALAMRGVAELILTQEAAIEAIGAIQGKAALALLVSEISEEPLEEDMKIVFKFPKLGFDRRKKKEEKELKHRQPGDDSGDKHKKEISDLRADVARRAEFIKKAETEMKSANSDSQLAREALVREKAELAVLREKLDKKEEREVERPQTELDRLFAQWKAFKGDSKDAKDAANPWWEKLKQAYGAYCEGLEDGDLLAERDGKYAEVLALIPKLQKEAKRLDKQYKKWQQEEKQEEEEMMENNEPEWLDEEEMENDKPEGLEGDVNVARVPTELSNKIVVPLKQRGFDGRFPDMLTPMLSSLIASKMKLELKVSAEDFVRLSRAVPDWWQWAVNDKLTDEPELQSWTLLWSLMKIWGSRVQKPVILVLQEPSQMDDDDETNALDAGNMILTAIDEATEKFGQEAYLGAFGNEMKDAFAEIRQNAEMQLRQAIKPKPQADDFVSLVLVLAENVRKKVAAALGQADLKIGGDDRSDLDFFLRKTQGAKGDEDPMPFNAVKLVALWWYFNCVYTAVFRWKRVKRAQQAFLARQDRETSKNLFDAVRAFDDSLRTAHETLAAAGWLGVAAFDMGTGTWLTLHYRLTALERYPQPLGILSRVFDIWTPMQGLRLHGDESIRGFILSTWPEDALQVRCLLRLQQREACYPGGQFLYPSFGDKDELLSTYQPNHVWATYIRTQVQRLLASYTTEDKDAQVQVNRRREQEARILFLQTLWEAKEPTHPLFAGELLVIAASTGLPHTPEDEKGDSDEVKQKKKEQRDKTRGEINEIVGRCRQQLGGTTLSNISGLFSVTLLRELGGPMAKSIYNNKRTREELQWTAYEQDMEKRRHLESLFTGKPVEYKPLQALIEIDNRATSENYTWWDKFRKLLGLPSLVGKRQKSKAPRQEDVADLAENEEEEEGSDSDSSSEATTDDAEGDESETEEGEGDKDSVPAAAAPPSAMDASADQPQQQQQKDTGLPDDKKDFVPPRAAMDELGDKPQQQQQEEEEEEEDDKSEREEGELPTDDPTPTSGRVQLFRY